MYRQKVLFTIFYTGLGFVQRNEMLIYITMSCFTISIASLWQLKLYCCHHAMRSRADVYSKRSLRQKHCRKGNEKNQSRNYGILRTPLFGMLPADTARLSSQSGAHQWQHRAMYESQHMTKCISLRRLFWTNYSSGRITCKLRGIHERHSRRSTWK